MESRRQRIKREGDRLAIGDKVIVANRFFDNHGIARVDLGVGQVVSSDVSPDKVQIVLPFNPVMLQYSINGYLKMGAFVHGPVMSVRIFIHLAYVEKFTQKRNRRR